MARLITRVVNMSSMFSRMNTSSFLCGSCLNPLSTITHLLSEQERERATMRTTQKECY